MKENETPRKGSNDNLEAADAFPTKQILVVGDWLVDEHWVTGVHRSSTSSRTGQAHYRALHNLQSTIQSFCGAGRVASLLYQYQQDNRRLFDIFGIGLWSNDDTCKLSQMFDFDNLIGKNHFTLTSPQVSHSLEGVHLLNLYQLLSPELGKRVCTTRIIRIYPSVQIGEEQFIRIDWESGPERIDKVGKQDDLPTWTQEITLQKLNSLQTPDRRNIPDTLDAIVIKDLNKGVVSKELIDVLATKYGKEKRVKWFVSTKSWMPSWFETLKRVDLRLLIIPQVAAHEAIRQNKLSCWITRSGYPDESVFTILEEIKEKVSENLNPHEDFKIIALPDGFSAVGFEPYKEGENCIIQTESSLHPALVPMGMASVFLPGVVGDYLQSPCPKSMKNLLYDNLRRTYNWVRFEADRLINPENWTPTSHSFVEDKAKEGNISFRGERDIHLNFLTFDWRKEKEFWGISMQSTGIIETTNSIGKKEKYLELWRSMVEVVGYVCCVKEKRKALRQLVRGIEAFCKGERKHHVGGILIDEPGSGKTYLVRKLAESLNLRFLPFNITLMFSGTDIIDCFDTIVTTQAQNRAQPVLVFIDEINSTLDNDTVYDAFLSPIEDGVYVRGGKLFHIDPCIWIFAGTEDPTLPKGQYRDRKAKETDFISRLSMGKIDMKQTITPRKNVENVYLGVCLIRNEFPDVRSVSEKVLNAFGNLPADFGIRRLKHMVKLFSNIQYGKVCSRNVPIDDFRKTNPGYFIEWEKEREGDIVSITELHHVIN